MFVGIDWLTNCKLHSVDQEQINTDYEELDDTNDDLLIQYVHY